MKLFLWNRLSLRQKIAGMMLLCMGVVSITTYIMFTKLAEEAEKGRLDAFKTHASSLSERIAAQFYERYADVQAFAINLVFRGKDTAQMQNVMDKYTKIYGIYDVIPDPKNYILPN